MNLLSKLKSKARRNWLQRQTLDRLQRLLSDKRGTLGLCYHTLAPEIEGYPYRTSCRAFDEQLRFLKDVFDLRSVADATDDLIDKTMGKGDRPVAYICFDDGYRDNLTLANAVLEKHEVPAMLFVARDLIQNDTATHMSEAELTELVSHPLWALGAHGITHNVLTSFMTQDQTSELTDCRDWLTNLTGIAPDAFAYPQGQISSGLISEVARVYDRAFVTDTRICHQFDRHQIRRYCPTAADDDIKNFAIALLEAPFENGLS